MEWSSKMKNGLKNRIVSLLEGILTIFTSASLGFVSCLPSYAESTNNEYLPVDRDIHNTFSNDQEGETLLDASSQMELMNRIRQANTMENATSPSDAIDEALRSLYEQVIDDPIQE